MFVEAGECVLVLLREPVEEHVEETEHVLEAAAVRLKGNVKRVSEFSVVRESVTI